MLRIHFGSVRVRFRQVVVIGCVGVALLLLLLVGQRAMADEKSAVPDAPGSIAGVVTNEAGVPMAGIEITALQQSSYGPWQVVRMVQTNQAGAYRIGLLSAGIYRLLFNDPNGVLAQIYYPNATTIETATDIPVAGTNVTQINVTLRLGGRITGTITSTVGSVTSAGGGTPSTYYAVRAFQKVGVQWVNVRTVGLAPQQNAYSLAGLPEGVYRVCTSSASPPNSYTGFDPFQECYDNVYAIDDANDVRVKAGQTTPTINFVLGDGTDMAQISGKVTALDGTPLAKVTVNAIRVYTNSLSYWFQYTQTNSAGVYQLSNLLPGPYLVSFSDNNGAYVSEIYSDVLQNDQATLLTLTHREKRPNIDAKLTLASHITGTLLIKDEGVPQNGSAIVYHKVGTEWQPFYPYTTNLFDSKTGQYQIGGLPAGVYKLGGYGGLFYSYGYQGFYGGKTLDEAALITLTVGETKPNANIILTQAFSGTLYPGQISGTVTANGAPVAGIKVSLYQANCCINPPQIPPSPAVTPVPIPTVTPGPNRTNDATASQVHGQATSAATSDVKPLVYVYTDAQGHYVIDGLQDGQYYLGVSDPNGLYASTYYNNHSFLQRADGLLVQNGRVLLPNLGSGLSTLNLSLARAGGISGNVQLKDGTPVANVAVEAFIYSEQLRWELLTVDSMTDEVGHYTIKGLPEGNYRLCFADLTGKYPIECDGAVDNFTADSGKGVAVKAGIINNSNHLLGPTLKFFLPLVARETFCTEISQISQVECAALFQIYKNATQSNPIPNFFGWFKDNQPCQWFGITCEANHVVGLKLDNTGLVTIPAQIGDLSNLQLLALSSNPLTTLPGAIGKLTNLQIFGMSRTQVTMLPPEFGNLINLQKLYLYGNPLTSLPPEIGNLANLRLLDLNSTTLTTLPPAVGRLTNLEDLNLQSSAMANLPAELGNMTNLKTLTLSYTPLHSLPPEIGRLPNLQDLNLTMTGIVALPDEFGNLPSLQRLNMRHVGMTEVPNALGKLRSLQNLNLSYNTLTSIPATLGQLHDLQWLDLSMNPVTSIAPELGKLTKLELLALSQGQMDTLPATLGNLISLRELYLPQNHINTIPVELGQLKNLQVLELQGNQLTILPATFGNLVSLRSLTLSVNQLTKLPPTLGNLSNLQKLSVGSNQLTALPVELGNLSNLQILDVNSNPQLSGSLPLSFAQFHLNIFFFGGTKLCEPTTATFQTWLSQIPNLQRSGLRCAQSS